MLNTPDNKCQQMLRTWLRTLGYANWALNAFPILKPALNLSYDKVSGKTLLSQAVYINKDVQNDLLWFADTAARLDSVRLSMPRIGTQLRLMSKSGAMPARMD